MAGMPLYRDEGVVLRTHKLGEADRIVFFADSQWNADLTVYRTDIASDVEWLNAGKSGVL